MIFPTAFALVSNATSEEERPRVTGALLGIAGIGTALGPVVGGVLASEVGWRWVFLLNVPIAAFAIWRGLRLHESRDEAGPRTLAGLDWWGVVTVVAGLALLSVAIDDVGVEGWSSVATLAPLLAGVALLAAFCVVETRAADAAGSPVAAAQPPVRRAHRRGDAREHRVVRLHRRWPRSSCRTCAGSRRRRPAWSSSSPRSGWRPAGRCPGRLSVRYPAGMVMGVAVLLSAPALALLALAGPLPLYVVALGLCGITTGMGYSLGQVAVQNVLPPERSAEGTSVLLTILICVGGIGVVAATAVVEAIGGGQPTSEAISVVLGGLGAALLVAGIVTLAVESRRVRESAAAG